MSRNLVFGLIGAGFAILAGRTPAREKYYEDEKIIGWMVMTNDRIVFIDVCDTFLLPTDWFHGNAEPVEVNAHEYVRIYTSRFGGTHFPVFAEMYKVPPAYFTKPPLLECPRYDATVVRHLRPERNNISCYNER